MVLEKREVEQGRRKDTFAIEGSDNKVVFFKYRYIITDPSGKILSRQYEKLGEFNRFGLAIATADEKKCVIKADGTEVKFASKYETFSLDDDVIRVRKKDKWGFTDTTGKVVCSPKFVFMERFVNGYARVRDEEGNWGIINKNGKLVVPIKYLLLGDLATPNIVAKTALGFGIINIKDEVIVPFKYRRIGKEPDTGKVFIYNTNSDILYV